MLHAVSLSVVVAYDMYLKVAEGELDQTWKENNIIEFWTYCDLLSNQMVKYNPTHCKYAGGTNMRPAKQQNKATRDNSKDDTRGKRGGASAEEVQLSNFAKKIQVSSRCQFTSVCKSHTSRNGYQVCRNRTYECKYMQGIWEGGLLPNIQVKPTWDLQNRPQEIRTRMLQGAK